MVHSSFKALGIADPESIIQALLDVIGRQGTLLMPALSYLQQPRWMHDTRTTPSCVGFLSEYFRTRSGTRRSLHPTHSVCAVGADVGDWLDDHLLDSTPCGEHSPFHKLLQRQGKILMLGCGLKPNTTMHAIEELVVPPYVFGEPVVYTITDSSGHVFTKTYTPHNFTGVRQRYERVAAILDGEHLRSGSVGHAASFLIDAAALCAQALACLRRDPFHFVDRV
jgi:aminoglycoside 3-N-acetyltransferase